MRYIVTGGAGFIGSHLVDALLEEGHEVVVIDNLSYGLEENLNQHEDNPRFEFYCMDILEELDHAFKRPVDAVFHLAALINVQESIKDPGSMHKTNVDGTFNLLEACRKHKVKRFVFSSSSACYGEPKRLPTTEKAELQPISPYALTKMIGEEYCRLYRLLYGLEPIMLRYFNVIGPRQNPNGAYACLIPKFITMIKSGKRPTINGDGKQTRDFVSVHDVVQANLLAAKTRNTACYGEAFNIGSGRNVSVNEVTAEILEAAGSSITPNHGPAVVEPRNTLADLSKAKQLLGWRPQVMFNKAMQEIFDFF